MAERLDNILKKYVAEGTATKDKLLGAAFVVVNKDGILYQGSAGRTRLAADSPPFTPDSITWIASMTKLVTVTCIMQLVERGLLALDADLRPLVPELAAAQILKGFRDSGEPILVDNPNPVTLRHLLTHTAGLGADVADPDLMRWSEWVGRTKTLVSCTREGFTTPLRFAPGEGWYYGTGTDWAGLVLEGAVGERLGRYMEREVWGKLGMRDTGFVLDKVLRGEGGEDKEARFVPISERDAETGELREGQPVFPADPEVESGGGGLYSSAGDYAKLVRALLRALAGEEGEGVPVRKKTAEEMFRPQLDDTQRAWLKGILLRYKAAPEFPDDIKVDHGIGGAMNMEDIPGKRKKGSIKWTGMPNSHWWIDPQTGIGGILFVNVTPHNDPVVYKLYDELELALYGELLPSLGVASSS
ncbi:hypothetical protein VTK26DRAFT_8747 [Humicola hyalothermophila]